MGEQQALDFADAQDRKWQHRRLLTSELKAARYLRLSIGINKQGIVDSYFQAVRGKLGTSKQDARQKAFVLLYGDGKYFNSWRGRRR